jgi:hypothetical protein
MVPAVVRKRRPDHRLAPVARVAFGMLARHYPQAHLAAAPIFRRNLTLRAWKPSRSRCGKKSPADRRYGTRYWH